MTHQTSIVHPRPLSLLRHAPVFSRRVGNRHGRVYLLPLAHPSVSGRDTVAHKNAGLAHGSQFPNVWWRTCIPISCFLQHFHCIPSRFLRAGGTSVHLKTEHTSRNQLRQSPEKFKSQPRSFPSTRYRSRGLHVSTRTEINDSTNLTCSFILTRNSLLSNLGPSVQSTSIPSPWPRDATAPTSLTLKKSTFPRFRKPRCYQTTMY